MSVLEQVKSGAAQFFETLGEGWSKLVARSGRALTRFTRAGEAEDASDEVPVTRESWGFLAGEIGETDSHLVVRIEAPGMEKDDFDLYVENGRLVIRGEKRFERHEQRASYHLFEAAYGSFERALPLPQAVDPDGAEADYRRGVLTVRLPKVAASEARRIRLG